LVFSGKILITKGVRDMLKRLLTFKNIIFFVLVIVLLLILPKIVNILLLFFAAYVIACALNPYVVKMQKHMSRSLASIIAVLCSCIAIFALFIPILFMTIREITTFLISLPNKIVGIVSYLHSTTMFGKKLSEIIFANNILAGQSDFAGNLVNQSWNFTLGIFEVAVIAVALMMIVYYLLVDKDYLRRKFIEFFPQDIKLRASIILSTISNKVGGYVGAQILSMIAVGLMTTIFLAVMRVDYFMLLGLITGIFDIVPIVGPTLALAIILLVAYPLGLVKVLIIIALFLVVQQLSNYVVRPIVFGKYMELHPLMMFLALFLAQQFLGFWGVILSPAIAATICVLIDELYLKHINEKNGAEADE